MPYESRISELIQTVRMTGNRNRIARINERTVRSMTEYMLMLLRQYQPPKYNPPEGEGVRQRPPHDSISEGWDGPVVRSTHMGGASAVIRNTSEHIDVIRYGHGEYWSPRQGIAFQKFFWSPERVWHRPIRERLEAMDNPIMTLYLTRHVAKGPWRGQDFVERAANVGHNRIMRLFINTGQEIAFGELRNFFR